MIPLRLPNRGIPGADFSGIPLLGVPANAGAHLVKFESEKGELPMADNASGYSGPIVLLGRICFSIVFILSSINHFNGQDIGYATAAHVPMAKLAVPLAGVLILVGGLSVLFGYKAKLGAWLIVIFLVPVTPMMHNFWAVTDPMMHSMQLVNFLKNLSMLGAALLITQYGAGPWSLDASAKKS